MAALQDPTAQALLERLGDTEHYPEEALSPYKEFKVGGKTYYFMPGGFLYRKDPGTEEVGASFVATSPTRSGTTGQTTYSAFRIHLKLVLRYLYRGTFMLSWSLSFREHFF